VTATIDDVLSGRARWALECGDALAVLPRLPAGCVDAVVTDPPFKLSQEYSAVADPDNLIAVSSIWLAAREWERLTKPGGLCAMFYDTRILPLALRSMADAGWKYLRALTLYRRWGQASLVHGWMSTSDFILLFQKPGGPAKFHGSPRHDVYPKDRPEPEWSGHKAQKPLDVVTHLAEHTCPLDGIVLDSYAGSGTTVAACLATGRRCIAVEISPDYAALARARLEKAETGGPLFTAPPQATLLDSLEKLT
jgi:site-specific DNA-methyltransferase (adenine-specific)